MPQQMGDAVERPVIFGVALSYRPTFQLTL
jgi:hypothetical protein